VTEPYASHDASEIELNYERIEDTKRTEDRPILMVQINQNAKEESPIQMNPHTPVIVLVKHLTPLARTYLLTKTYTHTPSPTQINPHALTHAPLHQYTHLQSLPPNPQTRPHTPTHLQPVHQLLLALQRVPFNIQLTLAQLFLCCVRVVLVNTLVSVVYTTKEYATKHVWST
jgi:hypothetical protein